MANPVSGYNVGGYGHTGIQNPTKNQGYMIAFFQALGHTDPYKAFVLRAEDLKDVRESKERDYLRGTVLDTPDSKKQNEALNGLVFAVHILIGQMWSNKFASVKLKWIKNAFNRCYKVSPENEDFYNFGSDQPMLSSHFMQFMLEYMHSAYIDRRGKRAQNLNLKNPINYMREIDGIGASVISDHFMFYKGRRVVCNECKTVDWEYLQSNKCITLSDLPDQDGRLSLRSRLNVYFQKNSSGPCPHHEDTNTLQEKCFRLLSTPTIFIIILQRFSADGTEKINTPVKFPIENLDLQNYIHRLTEEELNKFGAEQEFVQFDTTIYDLYAVINHEIRSEEGLEKDHYWTYAKTSHNSGVTGWRKFDDQKVTQFDKNELIKAPQGKTACILFYRKRDSTVLPDVVETATNDGETPSSKRATAAPEGRTAKDKPVVETASKKRPPSKKDKTPLPKPQTSPKRATKSQTAPKSPPKAQRPPKSPPKPQRAPKSPPKAKASLTQKVPKNKLTVVPLPFLPPEIAPKPRSRKPKLTEDMSSKEKNGEAKKPEKKT